MENNVFEYDFLTKILVVGSSGCGKSSLLLRYSEDQYEESLGPTIGVDFKLKTMDIEGKVVKLQLWDSAGQEVYNCITRSYYRGANGVAVVFDVTNEDSFQKVPKWIKECQQHAAENVEMILIGNKTDLKHKRLISTEQAQELAKEFGIMYFETSAKTAENVQQAFDKMAINLVKSQNYVKMRETQDPIKGPTKKTQSRCACQ